MANFSKITGKIAFQATLGEDSDKVIIGNVADTSKLTPQIILTRWKEEEKLGISFADIVPIETTPSLTQGNSVIVLDSVSVGFYLNKFDTENLKFGVIWKTKPKNNSVSFSFSGHENFDIEYQKPLSNLDSDGSTYDNLKSGGIARRTAEINGSYAIYHKTKKHHIFGGINYKVGKIGHIYRPKFVSADGKWTWGTLEYKDGILTESCPWDFLESAQYPIKSNATYGYSTQGGSSITKYNGDSGFFQIFGTAPEAGTLTNLSICLTPKNENQSMSFGWYAQNATPVPTTRLAYDVNPWNPGSTTKAFYINPVNWSFSLVSGTQYCGAFYYYYDGGTSVQYHFDSGSNITWWKSGGLTDPANSSGTENGTDYKVSAYATYTAGGGGEVGSYSGSGFSLAGGLARKRAAFRQLTGAW